MKRLLLVFPLLFITLFFSTPTRAQGVPPDLLLNPEELDQLVGPIALYPDPLIAQILPAATFIDQVEAAADYVDRYGAAGIDAQPWDISVRAIAHYPQLLDLLDQRPEWTAALGQAYLNQPQDLMDAIQRLRSAAYAEGNLASNPEQQVIEESDGIRIVPASPQYIYVPVYDPELVYVEPPEPGIAFITFGTPFLIGVWLDRDCDWRHRRVFYHGWRGGGWVGRSRPHIRDRGHGYIGRNARVIRVNREVGNRDTRDVRRELRGEAVRQRDLRGRVHRGTPSPPGGTERHRERVQRGGATGSAVTAPGRTAPAPQGRRTGPRRNRPATVAPPTATPQAAPAAPAPRRPGQDQIRSRGPSRGPSVTGGAAGGAAERIRRRDRVGNPARNSVVPGTPARRAPTAPAVAPRRHERGGAPGGAVPAAPAPARRAPAFNAPPPAATAPRSIPTARPSWPTLAPRFAPPVRSAPAIPARPATPAARPAPAAPAPTGGMERR